MDVCVFVSVQVDEHARMVRAHVHMRVRAFSNLFPSIQTPYVKLIRKFTDQISQ